MIRWEELPQFMRCPEVKEYYDILYKKRTSLKIKRIFDVVVAAILLFIFFFPMTIIALLIKLDSRGPVFYRQERVTIYGRKFYIHKFRTMVNNADRMGTSVTVNNDCRITKMGYILRNLRLDEIPQLFDVLSGNMSFVGTRPEVVKYAKKYSKEMLATLLLPAGITSEASIRYKDEAKLLSSAEDVDSVYIHKILPEKMKYNLESVRNFSFLKELLIMFRTVLAVMKTNGE